jgi:hypothetical protein
LPIHAGLLPASMVNQKQADLGIPNRFNLTPSRFNARRDIPETPAEPHFGQLADGANVRSIPDTYAAARTVVSPSRNSSIFGSVGCTCATVSSDIPDFRASGSLSGTFHSIGRSQRWLQRARSIGADVRSINGANVSSIPAVHRLSQTPPHLRPMSFFLGGDFFGVSVGN